MIFENEFHYIIPLGFNCNSANACNGAGVRKEKLPFDWMQIKGINEEHKYLVYQKMLKDMIIESLEFNIVKNKPDDFSILNYNAWIPHEQGDCDCDGIKTKYTKYFKRLKHILESNKKILIIISEFDVRNYNENLVEIYKNFLNYFYPNNDYYFLTININDSYINTNTHLNVIINERGHHVNGVWTDPYLAKSVEICKNIKLNKDCNTEVILHEE